MITVLLGAAEIQVNFYSMYVYDIFCYLHLVYVQDQSSKRSKYVNTLLLLLPYIKRQKCLVAPCSIMFPALFSRE